MLCVTRQVSTSQYHRGVLEIIMIYSHDIDTDRLVHLMFYDMIVCGLRTYCRSYE